MSIVFLLLYEISFGQTLFEIYSKLPSTVTYEEVDEREKMIQSFETGKRNNNIYCYLDEVDHENGYLTIEGPFEGFWQMCYWNLGNGNKLIAVLSDGVGFIFYLYDGTSFKPLKQPEIESITDSDFFDFNSEELNELYRKYDMPMGISFKLPRQGKNIVAHIYSQIDNVDSNYNKYLRPHQKGDKILFVFHPNGIFKKGTLFWDEQN